MLQIKEYDFDDLDTDLNNEIKIVDNLIKDDLIKISRIKIIKSFLVDLNKVVDINSDFSFIKASVSQVQQLKDIDTSIKINDLRSFNKKLKSLAPYLKRKRQYKNCTLNNLLEFIFGYHIEDRTQILKRILRKINNQNCVYCLAQYTTSYGVNNKKIYVKGTLDHIYPKSLNGLVSLSVNNLVPVCAHCNQRKSDADKFDFDFNPFDSSNSPTFNFKNVIEIDNDQVKYKDIEGLTIDDINPTLESRLQLSSLYKEYRSPIENLLERYKKFNSLVYKQNIENIINKNNNEKNNNGKDNNELSVNLEYFISETPYTSENIQNIPLHKFKSDFYKELEGYKKNGVIKFS